MKIVITKNVDKMNFKKENIKEDNLYFQHFRIKQRNVCPFFTEF